MSGSKILLTYLLVVACLLWMGMLLGVSFIATPAKFLTPSLSLPVALDVGHHTFAVFSIIEMALVGVSFVVALLSSSPRRVVALAALLGALVATQRWWLLPVLDARVDTLIAGGTLPDSWLHTLYIALEASKIIVLLVLAGSAFRHVDAARDRLRC